MNSDSLLYLWDRRSLFVGKLGEALNMCQGAACLIVSLGDPILYRSHSDEPFIEAHTVLTPAGCNYEVDSRGQLVANCMLDPFGEDYAMLLSQMPTDRVAGNGARYGSMQESEYILALRNIYEQALDYEESYALLDEALNTGVLAENKQHPVDHRIVAVVEELKHRVHENLSIDDLAAVANLSVSRLVQLFKKQTGIPIRRYRCWHRLFVASVMVAKTGNLTEASVMAGFTDASHFTKTFHTMVGMSPSKLLSQPQRVRLMVE